MKPSQKGNISKVKMALQYNKYFEKNSKCFLSKLTKKLELNEEQMSFKRLLLFLGSKIVIILSSLQLFKLH
jgi:hypothetical protein